MSGTDLLAQLKKLDVKVTVRGDRLVYDAPAGVMTPDLTDEVKRHKPELLVLLTAPQPASTEAPAETHADREVQRFIAVARPWPDGRGWYDPAEAGVAVALSRIGE